MIYNDEVCLDERNLIGGAEELETLRHGVVGRRLMVLQTAPSVLPEFGI
jgi:hypothetical protein